MLFEAASKPSKLPIGPNDGAKDGPILPSALIAPVRPRTVSPSKMDNKTPITAKIKK